VAQCSGITKTEAVCGRPSEPSEEQLELAAVYGGVTLPCESRKRSLGRPNEEGRPEMERPLCIRKVWAGSPTTLDRAGVWGFGVDAEAGDGFGYDAWGNDAF
jgi:hypothetical protein